jgi:5-oxoprolinase (ATP-hydrolysing)
MEPWKIWIDTGGTFTDCLALDPSSALHRLKILSSGLLRGHVVKQLSRNTFLASVQWPSGRDIYRGYRIRIGGTVVSGVGAANPMTGVIAIQDDLSADVEGEIIEIDTQEEVPVFAARLLTSTRLDDEFPAIEMKLGSTKGTNAILERKGARTALVVTKGFKDLLVIGTQQRPNLFALNIHKPPVYYERVIEVEERMSAGGEVVRPLEDRRIQHIIAELKSSGIESVAVALLNSYKNPAHEQSICNSLRGNGFRYVSMSSALSAQLKILPRAETAVANAYLSPVIDSYISGIRKVLNKAKLYVMASYGGLVDAGDFQPKDSLLSGPAGGVAGAAIKGRLSGIDKLITFDMGGTSTDVSLYDKRFDYRFESKVGLLKILSPSLSIETIAAGGGSICKAGHSTFSVGPESAGANPGPACYGKGGPLTLTDVNLLLGRIDSEHFAIPLSLKEAARAFEGFCKDAKIGNSAAARTSALLSLVRIANEKMAASIATVSTQMGHRPGEFTLLSFGGAGGQHACALAEILDMTNVLVPYDAGLLSAFGIGHARVQRFKEQVLLLPLRDSRQQLARQFDELEQRAREELYREGYTAGAISVSDRLAFVRFKGQESSLEIKVDRLPISEEKLLQLFRAKYRKIFGHWMQGQELEVESIRVSVEVKGSNAARRPRQAKKYRPTPAKVQKMITGSGARNSMVYRWEDLKAGAAFEGPALVISNNSTTVVNPGWELFLDGNNNAILTRKARARTRESYSASATLELFTNRFTAIAQQMGAMLQRTSFSVNVKERLDFSCALLDADGYLVVNAPHIPVHLGSLGICVREVIRKVRPAVGDVIITNHPAFGGSHLPDITLIKPVFSGRRLIGFVANRAHHAEIGGTRPGSMPANATTLEEEGVIIEPAFLVRNGKVDWRPMERIFRGAKYPTRSWAENQADLNGALASIRLGEALLQDLCVKYGVDHVRGNMIRLRAQAASMFRAALNKLPAGKFEATERLDDGSQLRVAMQKTSNRLVIDFGGSSNTHPGNLNATRAIVQSVVLYVIRILVDEPIPMNEGLMENVKLIIPKGLLNPDFAASKLPAVVGGNTEVSQRLTDTLLKALGLAACSQGTMNNFLFGNDRLGYYETICGGTGAGKGFDGTSAVHQHMTNTRITDPEVLEVRYPVRLERFEIRNNTGGEGKWRGGDGVVREFLFHQQLDISLLTQHRSERPYGLNGGGDGQPGRQFVVRSNGNIEALGGVDGATVYPGDRIVIETPGGGGHGKPERSGKA